MLLDLLAGWYVYPLNFTIFGTTGEIKLQERGVGHVSKVSNVDLRHGDEFSAQIFERHLILVNAFNGHIQLLALAAQ